MYHAATRLPHLLSPADYFAPEAFAAEVGDVFSPSWQLVGTVEDAPADGDFLTCDLFGKPILVRNCKGEFRAFANVCAHRHCLLTSDSQGHADRMRCQYHGWEYDDTGVAAKIPSPRNFAPLDRRSRPALGRYRAERCGNLLFVSPTSEGPSMQEYLGDAYEICRLRFGEQGIKTLALEKTLNANWKVPVENALESYHVPMIHGNTFREDPGDERSTHVLQDRLTEFSTSLPFAPHNRLDNFLQSMERRLLQTLGLPATGGYRHIHCFPNLLISLTDASAIIQCVVPTSATSSRLIVRQFGITRAGWPAWKRWASRTWGALSALIVGQILKEDIQLLGAIQKGLESSRNSGVLGRCEERIHTLQKWLVDQRVSGAACRHVLDERSCDETIDAHSDVVLAEETCCGEERAEP